ncbi:MAG: ABC transporter permease [Dehalococcoidia bacterium]|nr:ABC transporter permease [Dehalococcoidia bacterium]MCA9850946.1 ABC transporter permease [Dehalococcoidia bacterium]MCB9482500.1 ABC transporter permease [Dehalococcoidia bacterium]MCB9491316.1 ABC transporter permease [Dehalococcoidia bacterium]
MSTWQSTYDLWSGARRVGMWRASWRRFKRHRAAVFSAFVLIVLIGAALGANVLATHDPSTQYLVSSAEIPLDPLAPRETGKFEPPSAEHWLGTDQLARDIYSRTLFGLRISLAAALFAVVVVTTIGVGVGAAAASGAGWVDGTLMRATDLAYAFPDLLLVILLRAAMGDQIFGRGSILGVSSSVLLLFFAISITAWPTMARLVRAQMLVLRGEEFSLAAESLGASRWRLVTRHWLPGVAAPVIVEATFLVPRAIFAEATVSFIGIGVAAPQPSLGTLIADHFGFVTVQWTALAVPITVLIVLFLAFQFLGDGLRQALDPRSSG